MGLGGEVDDRVAARSGGVYGFAVADVAFDELEVRALQVRGVAGVGQLVEHDHLFADGGETLGEVRADEPGAAGDEHAHREQATVPACRSFGVSGSGSS